MSKISGPRAAKRGAGIRTSLAASAVALALIGLAFAGGDANAAKPALSSNLSVERPIITRGWTHPVYVLVHFSAPDLDVKPSQRPPLNLSLVLDRSGSMEDKGKIEYLRQAAKLAVARLGERDVVSVIEFDDRITLMWPAAQAHDIPQLQAQIDQLTPRGSTNLAGGMQRGIDEAQGARHDMHLSGETLSRVILLTDGLANAGVTSPSEIAEMAANARRGGVRVSSIGLGADYNEDLLQSVAEGGGGKYYFVESPIQLARIFEEELHSAFATSARDVHIAFHGGGAVRSAEMIGFAKSSGRDVSADWPDFYSGEERTVLLRLDVSADRDGSLDLGHFDVAWHDARNGASGTLDLPIRVSVTDDMAASDRSLNKNVSVEASLAESERTLAANVKLAAAGHADAARQANAAIIDDLKARNGVLKDERITRKLEALNIEQAQMTAAAAPAAPPEAMANYLKSSKQRLYQAKTGNRGGYVLQPGDKGIQVERLQQALASAGVYKGRVSGTYDRPTADAVKAYQKKNGVDADGVAGATTQMKLGLY